METNKNAEKILYILNGKGYEAYVVGGCVRDTIMGSVPGDWDVTTSAKPEEIKACFQNTYDTGIKHGTVTVRMENENFEVTTYRIEGTYSDMRHPDEVTFTTDLAEDLLRRDFTINAIAYHPNEGFVDPFLGMKDIDAKTIRGVGVADERFKEDALRMLRAVRFGAQLGFDIEDSTWKALNDNAPLIKNISVERIREELQKLIMSDRPEKVRLLFDSGLMKEIGANVSEILSSNVDTISKELVASEKEVALRWALFLKSLGENQARKFMLYLKFDTKTLNIAIALIAEEERSPDVEKYEIKKRANKIGAEIYEILLKYYKAENRENVDDNIRIYNGIIENKECIYLKELVLNGTDIKELGIIEGKNIGIALNMALDEVHKDNSLNNKEHLEKYISRHIHKD